MARYSWHGTDRMCRHGPCGGRCFGDCELKNITFPMIVICVLLCGVSLRLGDISEDAARIADALEQRELKSHIEGQK